MRLPNVSGEVRNVDDGLSHVSDGIRNVDIVIFRKSDSESVRVKRDFRWDIYKKKGILTNSQSHLTLKSNTMKNTMQI